MPVTFSTGLVTDSILFWTLLKFFSPLIESENAFLPANEFDTDTSS